MKRSALGLILVLTIGVSHAELRYQVRSLPTVGGRPFYANGLNDNGMICGSVYFGSNSLGLPEYRAYVYSQSSGFVQLPYESPRPYLSQMLAERINNAGQVLGYHDIDGSMRDTYLWSATQGIRWQSGVGASGYMSSAINNSGASIGNGVTVTGLYYGHGVYWSPEGTPLRLDGVIVRDLNDNGRIVASSGGRSYFLDIGGTWTPLSGNNSLVMSVNSAGFMAGSVAGTSADPDVVFWNPAGNAFTMVGRGWGASKGPIINDRMEVVFSYQSSIGPSIIGQYWSPATGLRPFDSLLDAEALVAGFRVKECLDLNNYGQAIARVWRPGMQSWDAEIMLLDPVPEPTTLATLAVGTAALFRRRRQ